MGIMTTTSIIKGEYVWRLVDGEWFKFKIKGN